MAYMRFARVWVVFYLTIIACETLWPQKLVTCNLGCVRILNQNRCVCFRRLPPLQLLITFTAFYLHFHYGLNIFWCISLPMCNSILLHFATRNTKFELHKWRKDAMKWKDMSIWGHKFTHTTPFARQPCSGTFENNAIYTSRIITPSIYSRSIWNVFAFFYDRTANT